MKRGTKPTPTLVLRNRGSWRAKHRADYNARLKSQAPTIPKWLSAEARREWKRVIPLLKHLGIIQKVDKAALEMYCMVYAEWVGYEMEIKRLESRFVRQPSGRICAHPLLTLRDQAYSRLRKTASELGLTPCSRTSLNIYHKPVVDDDKAKFFGDYQNEKKA